MTIEVAYRFLKTYLENTERHTQDPLLKFFTQGALDSANHLENQP